MDNKIDIIITYVNPNDENWVKLYNQYIRESVEEFKEKRFRDTSFLKYVLRSIDKNIPWINKVFLVVQSDSQVPEWVNREEVNVVLHEEFIPKEYLPTFNCNTIELFMHKIPNLSDYFIYFNDDMIVNKYCYANNFFYNGKCNLLSFKKNTPIGKNTWFNCLYNNTRIINNFLKKEEDINTWHRFPHTITPLYKPMCEEAYGNFEKEIKSRITRFRDYINFNQHFYAYYIENSSMCSNIPVTVNYVNINKYYKTFLQNANAQTLCINDSVISDVNEILKFHKIIVSDLEHKFPKESKYEKKNEVV